MIDLTNVKNVNALHKNNQIGSDVVRNNIPLIEKYWSSICVGLN